MNSLVEIDKLIKQAKKAGINFGKGDPYNRLRYYTKIGWLPHMIRQKTNDGEVKGHYPNWVLERLIQIETMKKQGASNEQIEAKINTRNKVQTLYAQVNTPEFKNKLVMYATAVAVVIILLSELNIINISKSKESDIVTRTATSQISSIPAQITDSGVSFIPANKNKVYIKNSYILPGARVYITFNQNFSPANRYWVSEIEPEKGFYVELDAPVFDNAEFSWWISN